MILRNGATMNGMIQKSVKTANLTLVKYAVNGPRLGAYRRAMAEARLNYDIW